MSFAAPVPRIPLASVLRHLDASWAPNSPIAPGESTPTRAHPRGTDTNDERDAGDEPPQLGLGLMLGAACVPIHIPRPYLSLESPSQSPSRYSRRLRSIAPAPLELASSTLSSSHRAPPSTPPRAAAAAAGPASARPASQSLSSAVLADVPLATARYPPQVAFYAPSASPLSDHNASMTSMAAASLSTAPTSLLFPPGSENAYPPPYNYQNMFPWQRPPSRAPQSPLLSFPSKPPGQAGPSAPWRDSYSPRTPTRNSTEETYTRVLEERFTSPTEDIAFAPPPLRRTEWVPLPEVETMDVVLPSPSSEAPSMALADLRLDLGVEDLTLRSERCSETIARASLSLCSCSLLRDPHAIMHLCDRLRATISSVQCALDETPSEFATDRSEAKRTWYAKHWQIISSLDRNLNMFYLLAHQIEKRPPRIHRLASIVDKLATYQAKFADLARRIVLSYEKLRFLSLRSQLTLAYSVTAPVHAAGRAPGEGLRHDARAARQEGRARRREIREEISRVRGRIRAIREREFDVWRDRDREENMTPQTMK
ncbi:hypothetical protein C8Q77DRAFT_1065724 [Trametes polyzona]|nr:hypothetical protein C8Q77DRAFT_1065724 [Trametes polyzona]